MLSGTSIVAQTTCSYHPNNFSSAPSFLPANLGKARKKKIAYIDFYCIRNRNGNYTYPCLYSLVDSTVNDISEEKSTVESATSVCRRRPAVTSRKLLQWLRSSSTTDDVKRLHAVFLKHSNVSDICVANKLINIYAGLKMAKYARNVFDQISDRNVVTWTAMIDGYINCCCDNEALKIYEMCVEDGFLGNAMTFVCVLNLCRKTQDIHLGRQIHACVVKGNHKNVFIDSAVVHFYAQCDDMASAHNLFDRMPERDIISWTGLITSYSQQGKGEEALNLLPLMLKDGFTPNGFTICAVLKACADEKQLHLGRQLHSLVAKKMIEEDKYVGSCLVDMYAKCGQLPDSRQVFDGMTNSNTVTWTSMIAGYARAGDGEESINLYRIMKRRKISSNNLTTLSVLKACGAIRAALLGREIHAQVMKNHSQNGYMDSTLVWFYCKCGKSMAALNVLSQMPSRTVVSWTAMISGYAGLGHEAEALSLMRTMMEEGVAPNAFTLSSALKACALLESVNQGKLIHSVTSKKAGVSNAYVANALIHMYAKCGHVAEATRVFESMRGRDTVSWRAMILGYARNGMFKEALKLVYQMRDERIEVDDYTLATVLNGCASPHSLH